MDFEHFAPPLARFRQLWRKAKGGTQEGPMNSRESVIPFGNNGVPEVPECAYFT